MPLSPSDRALGDLLVGRRVITLPQLDEATELAERWNVRLGDALLSRNWIDPRRYYETYAQNLDLPFVDMIHEPPQDLWHYVHKRNLYSEHRAQFLMESSVPFRRWRLALRPLLAFLRIYVLRGGWREGVAGPRLKLRARR